MQKKYEKPVAKNLGEMLPKAEGYCLIVGTSANIIPPYADCRSGLSAQGAVCGYGGLPSNSACQQGTTPTYFGCLPGFVAHPEPCNSGDGVY
jgi:hypothetical protein